jgi:hypothetical protein
MPFKTQTRRSMSSHTVLSRVAEASDLHVYNYVDCGTQVKGRTYLSE